MESLLTHLECTNCGRTYDADRLHSVCPACGKVLFARYNLDRVRNSLTHASLDARPRNLWRFTEIMPVRHPEHRLSLGEGSTPLVPIPAFGKQIDLHNLWVKDEARNPTGSFKARGLAAAVSRAKELGVTSIALPSAGNAAAALAAYAACAGIEAFVFMPEDTPNIFIQECSAYGANVFLVQGLINDAGTIVGQYREQYGWFDASTLKEPYRVEGKKTMGLELAEDLNWRLPDVIVYPTGGGTGIIGMWKAFEELEQIGLIGSERPRMIAVQADGCKPIVDAWKAGVRHAPVYKNAQTIAPGIRVPAALGDYLILDLIHASNGHAISVSDSEILHAMNAVAHLDGCHFSPEVGACFAAAKKMRQAGHLSASDHVVVFATGSGLKHMDLVNTAAIRLDPSAPDLSALMTTTRQHLI